jgi:hypothetical protein
MRPDKLNYRTLFDEKNIWQAIRSVVKSLHPLAGMGGTVWYAAVQAFRGVVRLKTNPNVRVRINRFPT